ncbi:MAG: nicotinate-nucleotide adenylyltransferase [Bacteroidales bacterium]|nr:nicotinate-nucleotide adenylyltransferase [Bacteroidales bacterium]MBN2750827.1 nicotinate-nucleotide adenylyltransferase [Bacteroidales bacterium]
MNVGLFFGSFNPIHNGHLAIAQFMLSHTSLTEVWFVVSPHNPLKPAHLLADDNLRLEMVRQTVASINPNLRVCSVEFKMSRPSFTIDTLRQLEQMHPSYSFTLLMGADSIASIMQWKEHQALTNSYNIFVYPRPGIDLGEPQKLYSRVTVVSAPILPISSTLVREHVAAGMDIAHLVPEVTAQFIKSNAMYQTKQG